MRSIALVTTFVLFAACATAGQSASPGPVAAAPAPGKALAGEPKKVKVICTNEKVVGSNFSERVCRRVDENEDLRDQTQLEILRPHATQLRPGG
jgi:hypothetical protein